VPEAIRLRLLVPLFLLLLNCFPNAETRSQEVPTEPPRATLTARIDKAVSRRGGSIQVTLTLRAGPRGAYVSRWSRVSSSDARDFSSGRSMSNVSGFDVFVLTLGGKNADPIGHGGVADRWGPPPPPSERFKEEFVFLRPGKEETWSGNVDGPATPGKYQIVGVYMPAYDQVHDLVRLPETQGLLIADVVRSAPVIIEIK